MKLTAMLFVLLTFLFVSQSAFAGCRAEAEVRRFWEEKHGFIQKANLNIRVTGAQPGAIVQVYVDAKFFFERADGWSSTTLANKSGYIGGRSGNNLLLEAVAGGCSSPDLRPDTFCRINDVTIVEVNCHD